MGGDPEGPLRAAYALADPALLSPAVPVVLLHGTDDRTVLPEVPAPTRSGCARGAAARPRCG